MATPSMSPCPPGAKAASDVSVARKLSAEPGSLDHSGSASAPANTTWVILGQSRLSNCAYDFQVSTDAGMRVRIADWPPGNQDMLSISLKPSCDITPPRRRAKDHGLPFSQTFGSTGLRPSRISK